MVTDELRDVNTALKHVRADIVHLQDKKTAGLFEDVVGEFAEELSRVQSAPRSVRGGHDPRRDLDAAGF